MKKTFKIILTAMAFMIMFSLIGPVANAGTYKHYKEITDFKQQYCVGTAWKQLTSSSYSSYMSGIRLITNSNYFYLEYKAKNQGSSAWLEAVKSTDSAEYAGIYGKSMTNVAIKVYNKVNSFYDDRDYVVMYRAMSGDKWCSWVSNATPDAMKIIKNEYGLEGELDTSSTDAGDARWGVINAIQIRIFERNSVTSDSTLKLINAPYINQKAVGLPNGCEAVSAVMALNALSYSVSADTFVSKYLDMGAVKTDPSENFVGDPRLSSGWGCYASVIKKDIDKVIDAKKHVCRNVSGASLGELCEKYIDRGYPVILWMTMFMMTGDCTYSYWITPSGKNITYNNKQHCVLLVGYDKNYYYVNDPLTNVAGRKYIGYPKSEFEASYSLMNKQAVVIDTATAAAVSILSLPSKTVYKTGDAFDTSGMTVKVTFPNGDTKNVTDYKVSSPDMTVEGDKTVTVSWSDATGKTLKCDFTITVIDPEPHMVGIKANIADGKNIYEVGQSFDADCISVYAVWETKSISDGAVAVSTKEELIEEGYQISEIDTETAGEKNVTVSYNGATATLIITVSADHIDGSSYVETDPTCTEHGERVFICALCGKESRREEITPLGHDFSDEYTLDIEPDYLICGEKSRHCIRCEERCDITEIDRLISDIIGDVNGDGEINTKDVLLLRKCAAGIVEIPSPYDKISDVNADGEVNTKDVLLLRKCAAGIIVLNKE